MAEKATERTIGLSFVSARKVVRRGRQKREFQAGSSLFILRFGRKRVEEDLKVNKNDILYIRVLIKCCRDAVVSVRSDSFSLKSVRR